MTRAALILLEPPYYTRVTHFYGPIALVGAPLPRSDELEVRKPLDPEDLHHKTRVQTSAAYHAPPLSRALGQKRWHVLVRTIRCTRQSSPSLGKYRCNGALQPDNQLLLVIWSSVRRSGGITWDNDKLMPNRTLTQRQGAGNTQHPVKQADRPASR